MTSPLSGGSTHVARSMRGSDHHRRGTGRYHSRVTDPIARPRTSRLATIETLSLRTGRPMQPLNHPGAEEATGAASRTEAGERSYLPRLG